MSSNDGSHLALARALVLRGETKIDPDRALALEVDLAERDGHAYSDRPPGTAFVAMPSVWIGARLDPVMLERAKQQVRAGVEVEPLPAAQPYIATYAQRTSGPRGAAGPALAALIGTSLAISCHAAPLIPPPRFHMLRYHGVLAAHANARAEVVPGPEPAPPEPTQLSLVFDASAGRSVETRPKRPSRHPWPWLLQRVFGVDIMVCPRCRGPMKLLKIANEPDAIARVLAEVGLGPRPPPRSRPALPGQLELLFVA